MDRRIEDAIVIIRNDTRHQLKVSDLTRRVHLSPSRFSQLFKSETSLSPKRYRHEYRLQLAKMLLELTQRSVDQIASRLGYRRATNLTRDFTKRYGCPPSTFRVMSLRNTPWRISTGEQTS